ncbi:MAG: PAS domain-containing protein [Marinilabiliaceae bacterium]|nr:PAS domain-containing protein [Marinilabiliaceae bacterium]
MNSDPISPLLKSAFFLALLFYSIIASADDFQEIVVLNSYHPGFKWSTDITHAIGDYYKNEESVRLFNEFMDSKRFHSPGYFKQLEQFLKIKYADYPIDGVICADNYAFDFFLNHGSKIWGDIPAVFCGVNNIQEYKQLLDSTKHAAVVEQIDVLETLKIIQSLQPDLQEIIVISDETLSGQIFAKQFNHAIQKTLSQIRIRFTSTSDPLKLKAELQSISPENKAIYLLSLYTNRSGIPHEMVCESHFLFDDINIPIYSNWDFLLKDLIVGGRLIKAYDQGFLAAQLMHQKLKNKPTPLLTTPPHYNILDQKQLQRHQLKYMGNLDNIEIINQPESFIQRFKKELIILLIILIVLIFIILLLTTDIIKRKRIELALVKSEKRLELAMEGANEGLWDTDMDSFYYNDQFAKLLEYEHAEDLDLSIDNWKKYVVSEDIDQIREAYEMHASHKLPTFKCEVRLILKSTKTAWFSIHGRITSLENGVPARLTGTMINISTQKEFEDQLKQAKEKAEESDRLKSSFLANMSHEIRTPMNAILGFTDLLTEGNLNPKEQQDYLNLINSSGENLLSLINDIIDISKIESGEMTINTEAFDIHEMLTELKGIGNSLVKTHKKNINIRILKEIKDQQFFIHSDSVRLYQVMLNLLSNAIKFTENGFVDIDYTILNHYHIQLSVKDTGPGISKKDQQIIFDRFRQIDESTVKKHGGTGLGLSITKSIVQLLGGTITLHSEPGKGAEFIIHLPCKIVIPTAVPQQTW